MLRRLHFTEAARDLGLTQAAVSFRIKTLEQRLGIALFERGNHLLLTESGQLYLPIVVDVLKRLERGTTRVVSHGARRQRTGTLRLLVTQSVASLWLIPRLGDFCTANPGISLSIVSWIGGHSEIVAADFNRHNIDAAILNSRDGTNWNNLEADKIIADYAVPVCGPSLMGAPSRHRRRRLLPAELRNHALIHAHTWPDAWSSWLTHMGASEVEPKDNLWFQHTGLSVQAAMNGLGWAIAHGPLVPWTSWRAGWWRRSGRSRRPSLPIFSSTRRNRATSRPCRPSRHGSAPRSPAISGASKPRRPDHAAQRRVFHQSMRS